jgi:hypothetical protein
MRRQAPSNTQARAHTHTYTYTQGVLCHDTEKQHTEACSLHANTHECSISHSNCFSGTLKQKVPEHSMQCTQCSRRDHISLLSHSNCFSGSLKQKVPEHSMQCTQCSRRDHISLLMLDASWCFAYGLNVGNLHAIPSTHMPNMPM